MLREADSTLSCSSLIMPYCRVWQFFMKCVNASLQVICFPRGMSKNCLISRYLFSSTLKEWINNCFEIKTVHCHDLSFVVLYSKIWQFYEMCKCIFTSDLFSSRDVKRLLSFIASVYIYFEIANKNCSERQTVHCLVLAFDVPYCKI